MMTKKQRKTPKKLNKKELLSIVDNEIKWNKSSIIFRVPTIKYIIASAVEKTSFGKILVLSFYDINLVKDGKIGLSVKVFLSKDDYISFSYDENKWFTGSVDKTHFLKPSYYNDVFLFRTERDEKRVLKFFNDTSTKTSAIKKIIDFQYRAKDKRHRERLLKLEKKIDDRMKDIEKIPKRFIPWVKKRAFVNNRYLFYKRIRSKKYEAFCSYCGKEVNINYAKHNTAGVCPVCKKNVIFKSVGYSKNILDWDEVSLIEKSDYGLVVRYFEVCKDHRENLINPQITYRETFRTFVITSKDKLKAEYYTMDYFKGTSKYRWCECRKKQHSKASYVYTGNLKYELKDTKLYSMGIKNFFDNVGYVYAETCIAKFINNPAVEYLTKLRLYNIAFAVISEFSNYFTINEKGKTLKQILGISREGLKKLREIGATPIYLAIFQKLTRANVHYSVHDVVMIEKYISFNKINKLITILKHCTMHKAFKYLSEQNKGNETKYYYGGKLYDNTVSDWLDYISDCIVLNYNLKKDYILFPRNLKQRHKELSSLIKENKSELMDKAISRRYDMLVSNYGYENNNLCIVVPKNSGDIVNDGASLSHCVGRNVYIENMAKGISDILFIRNKDDLEKSYFTVEIQCGTILQCRGFNNCAVNKEVDEFIGKWLTYVQHNSRERINEKNTSLS